MLDAKRFGRETHAERFPGEALLVNLKPRIENELGWSFGSSRVGASTFEFSGTRLKNALD